MVLQQLLLLPRAVRLHSAVPLQAAVWSWCPGQLSVNSSNGAAAHFQGTSYFSSIATPSHPSSGAAAPSPSAAAATITAAPAARSVLTNAYTLIARASATLNQLTGYHTIEEVKQWVVAADQRLQQLKRDLRQQKLAYDEALAQQTHIHREMTSLLQRKAAWGPSDVTRFAELAGQEHANERAVGEARSKYNVMLEEVEAAQLGLTGLIRERYQQEQLWSDKIRRASTWWTWGLLGAHFTSFVVVYAVIEPRKRAALQAAIAGMLEEQQAALMGAWGERGGGAEVPAVAPLAAAGGGAGGAAVPPAAAAAGGRLQEGGGVPAGGGVATAAGDGVGTQLGAAGSQEQQHRASQQRHQHHQQVGLPGGTAAEQQRPAGAVLQQAGGGGPVAGAQAVKMQEGDKQLGEGTLKAGMPLQQQQQQQQQQHEEQAAGAAATFAAVQREAQPQQQQQQQLSEDVPTRARDWLQQKSKQLQAAAAGSWQAVSSRLRGGAEQQAQESEASTTAAAGVVAGVGQSAGNGDKTQQSAAASSSRQSGAGRGQPKWMASCQAALQQQYTLTVGQLAVVSTSSLALGLIGSWVLAAVAGSAKPGGNASGAGAGS